MDAGDDEIQVLPKWALGTEQLVPTWKDPHRKTSICLRILSFSPVLVSYHCILLFFFPGGLYKQIEEDGWWGSAVFTRVSFATAHGEAEDLL